MSIAADRFHRLYTALRERICLLDYPPGHRLSEEALASEFGTSRTPLRRVLARLEDEGLVESRHGVGTLVTDVGMAELTDTYALRLELTQLLGTLSPLPVTQAHLDRLDRFLVDADALTQDPCPRAFARLNMEYHAFGLSLCGNAALTDTAERLYYSTARIWLKSIPRMDLAAECTAFRDEIAQAGDALRAGDTQAAALIRRAHISMSFARLQRA
ncbi:GntR family transcriptional regulator [Thetidibacter halocola]|uniref:GntR family transcriptional regulator n=1 Tax=Thetidibacter halocola TaxID=2827239 RepID=A0A8J8BA13_9RHOB|nr:GntR family transcriptional regulator [Thetidibacter halocola]MBS0126090.1 GntR family transcriptional regulator [Thetidibacter halocola]